MKLFVCALVFCALTALCSAWPAAEGQVPVDLIDVVEVPAQHNEQPVERVKRQFGYPPLGGFGGPGFGIGGPGFYGGRPGYYGGGGGFGRPGYYGGHHGGHHHGHHGGHYRG